MRRWRSRRTSRRNVCAPLRMISTPPRPRPADGGISFSLSWLKNLPRGFESSAEKVRSSALRQPVAVEEDFGPAGEIHTLVAPLDALTTAGSNHLGVTSRAAEGR